MSLTQNSTSTSGAALTDQGSQFANLDKQCNKWLVQFEENERDFHESVLLLRRRDEQLRQNAARISELNKSVQGVLSRQEKVERELDFIASQHAEIQSDLTTLEAEYGLGNGHSVSAITRATEDAAKGQLNSADRCRRNLADILCNLDDTIKNISGEVDTLVNQFYENSDGQQVRQIAQVLNAQLESLQILEKQSKLHKHLQSANVVLLNEKMSNWSTSDWPEGQNAVTDETTIGGTLKSTLHGTSRLKRVKTGEAFTIPFIGNAIGKTPFFGIDNSIICSIQLAIHEFTRKHEKQPERDLLIQDFQHYDSTFYPQGGSETTPKHKFTDFRFSVFAPTAFRYFRNTFQIHSLDYINSISSQPLVPLSNPGRSGSILYVTSDDRFILKSVQKREAIFLARLLPGYFLNVIQNRQTLLPKFFGMYSYSSRLNKVRFIVMNNLIPSNIKIDVKFDLKGSTHKRFASEFERSKPNPTLKDLDFCEMFNSATSSGICLHSQTRDALLSTLEKDCRVLQSFSIMDYSLLLGVHNCAGSSTDENSNVDLRAKETLKRQGQNSLTTVAYLTSIGSIAKTQSREQSSSSEPSHSAISQMPNKCVDYQDECHENADDNTP